MDVVRPTSILSLCPVALPLPNPFPGSLAEASALSDDAAMRTDTDQLVKSETEPLSLEGSQMA